MLSKDPKYIICVTSSLWHCRWLVLWNELVTLTPVFQLPLEVMSGSHYHAEDTLDLKLSALGGSWFDSKNDVDNVLKIRAVGFLSIFQTRHTTSPLFFWNNLVFAEHQLWVRYCAFILHSHKSLCQVVHYYSVYCCSLAGLRCRLGDVKDDAWTNRKQNYFLFWSPSLYILILHLQLGQSERYH